jgi:aryl-alcohol dehydrogenase-like predicted oxidoreductase
MVQLSLGWILQNPNIAAAVCGGKSRLQIRQSILASGIELKPDAIMAIDQVVGERVGQQAGEG